MKKISPKNIYVLNKLRMWKRQLGYGIDDIFRTILWRNNEIVNHKEIRVVGLKRSGNHAIINWIRKAHYGEVWHLNNIPTERNPYRFLYEHYPKEKLRLEATGNFVKKDCLIYSYEDYEIDKITSQRFESKHDIYLGKSATRYDVLILRDPFNMIASRIQKDMMKVRNRSKTIVEIWISYAQEYLHEKQYMKHNKVVINYNKWFTDINYRKQIALELNFEFDDRGINEVMEEGGGSSFDGLNFKGKAVEMNVLKRWEEFVDNPLFCNLLNNEELIEYSEKIFGYIPGTEYLKIHKS